MSCFLFCFNSWNLCWLLDLQRCLIPGLCFFFVWNTEYCTLYSLHEEIFIYVICLQGDEACWRISNLRGDLHSGPCSPALPPPASSTYHRLAGPQRNNSQTMCPPWSPLPAVCNGQLEFRDENGKATVVDTSPQRKRTQWRWCNSWCNGQTIT